MPEIARQLVLELASHTGWALSELLDLDGEELVTWHHALRESINSE
ncbi:MAG: hypothetical protein MI742_05920 [Desulfobacterales bacterium]|nr:hypothetical protein [Desulfobacterales bacterium]